MRTVGLHLDAGVWGQRGSGAGNGSNRRSGKAGTRGAPYRREASVGCAMRTVALWSDAEARHQAVQVDRQA